MHSTPGARGAASTPYPALRSLARTYRTAWSWRKSGRPWTSAGTGHTRLGGEREEQAADPSAAARIAC